MSEARCELCGRVVPRVTKHHLIPRTRHSNRRNKKLFDRTEIHRRVAWLCPPCHKQVHAVLTEKQLEREYNSVAKLAAHPDIAQFVAWIAKRPQLRRVRTRRRG
jgi:hypothetical protein